MKFDQQNIKSITLTADENKLIFTIGANEEKTIIKSGYKVYIIDENSKNILK